MDTNLQLSDYQATMLAIVISADGDMSEQECLTAATLFGSTFGYEAEDSLERIQSAFVRLAPLTPSEREETFREAAGILRANLGGKHLELMLLMLEKVAESDGLDSTEESVLAWLRSAWNVGGCAEDEAPEGEGDCPPLTTTIDVLENLLATAVSGARLRAMAVLHQSSFSDEQRDAVENSFWTVVDSIFFLASVDENGEPVAEDAPICCAGFGSMFKFMEKQSPEPEMSSFLNLLCQYSALFPERPLPYEVEEGMEEFESGVSEMVKKKLAGLKSGWREEMLAPIERKGKEDTDAPAASVNRAKSTGGSGCALFLLAGVSSFVPLFIM